MLEKLYKKSELWFALLFIIIYVVGSSILDQFSNEIGIEMVLAIPFNLVLLLVLFGYIKKNNLKEYYGICAVKVEAKKLLFYIPLIIISTVNVWFGFCIRKDLTGTLVYIISMLLVGVTEELLFRGLLFKAMSKKNLKAAIIVTSITFGLGHIVNLFNGSGMELVSNICQLFYAVAIGFLLVSVLCCSKSIIPCMITHSVFNSLSVFANEEAFDKFEIPVCIALCVISAVSAWIIFKGSKNKEE